MSKMTVGGYLVRRLEQLGLRHVFGVPGDYVLGFFDLLVASEMQVIGTCTEIGAGFAADGYARVNGLGAVCITYCVGGFNALNAVAGAYAEKSPLIMISGAPGMNERARSPLLHHRVRDFNTQRLIFEKVTIASTALEDAVSAPQEIDRVLSACVLQKRPVYIELPRDMVNQPCAEPGALKIDSPRSDSQPLAEAVAEAAGMMKAARRPVILGGVEIHRFGLQEPFLKLIEGTGYPVAAVLLGKSIISERHPQYLGIYEGAIGKETVRKAVEGSDCLLIMGAFLTDIDIGGFGTRIDPARTVNATADRISIRHHHFDQVVLGDFLRALTKAPFGRPRRGNPRKPRRFVEVRPFKPVPRRPVTVRRFFQRMNDFLDQNTMVICDIGDSLFGAADLVIHRRTEFLSPAYYTSMGFSVPAAVGAQVNNRKLRPVVFVGDGAFQMTGMELSTAVRYGLNPIVFVLNNRGYTTERFIHEGPYNDVHEWAYHNLPQVLGAGWGCQVQTEGQLEHALEQVRANDQAYAIINVELEPMDHSLALGRLAKRLGKRVGGK
ncbi:MAG: thiamine pyrophosphate-binding protein [Phycisphaeraceae bacterium]